LDDTTIACNKITQQKSFMIFFRIATRFYWFIKILLLINEESNIPQICCHAHLIKISVFDGEKLIKEKYEALNNIA
jgi:hypothetical protein